jgi:hypothetical protein
MADSKYRPSGPRRPWRAQAAADNLKPDLRRFKRGLFTLVSVGLLVVFGWILYSLFMTRTTTFLGRAVEYGSLAVPPLEHAGSDVAFITDLPSTWRKKVQHRVLGSDVKFDQITRLEEVIGLRKKDTLIVYLSAHAISEDGKGYLLPETYDPTHATSERYPIESLLDSINRSKPRMKLLILDWGSIEHDPRMGMVANEFPEILAREAKKLGVPGDHQFWILATHTAHETRHLAFGLGHSKFGAAVTEGFAGSADGCFEDSPPDDEIDLAELYRFVRVNISLWVDADSDHAARQTPILIKAGTDEIVDDPNRVPREPLTIVQRPEPEEDAAALGSEQVKPDAGGADEKEKDKQPAEAKEASRRSVVNGFLFASQPAPGAPAQPASTPPAQGDTPAAPAQGSTAGSQPPPPGGAPTTPPAGSATGPGAPPADSGAASPTPEGSAGGAAPPPAADGAPVAPRPATPDATGGIEPLFQKVWKAHDRMIGRTSDNEWTPADYAPHLWREFQATLLSCEARFRAGQHFGGSSSERSLEKDREYLEKDLLSIETLNKNDRAADANPTVIVERLRDARREFLEQLADKGQVYLPGSEQSRYVVVRALQVRNDWMAQLPYWARAEVGTAGSTAADAPQSDLAKLSRALDAYFIDGVERGTDLGPFLQELAKAVEPFTRTGGHQDVLRQALNDECQNLVLHPADPGNPERITRLLEFPLADAQTRTRLRAALAGLAPTTLPWNGKPATLSTLPKLPGRADPSDARRTYVRRIEAEAGLLSLTDPEQVEIESLFGIARDVSSNAGSEFWTSLRGAGNDLSDLYVGLLEAFPVPESAAMLKPTLAADRKLRFVDPRDASEILQAENPIPGLLKGQFARPTSVALSLAGSDEVRLRVGTPETVSVSVVAQDVVPEDAVATVRVEFDSGLLLVESAAGLPTAAEPNAKRIAVSRLSEPLEWQLRAKADTGETVSFTVVLTVDDKSVRRAIECRLPQPDLVELALATRSPGQTLREQTSGRKLLAPFPNRATEYVMSVVNRSGSKKQVRVELYRSPLPPAGQRRHRTGPFDALGNLLFGFEKVAATDAAKPMELPETEQAVPVPFVPFPPAPAVPAAGGGAPAGEGAGGQPATPAVPAVPGPDVSNGMVAVIYDVQKPGTYWPPTWIDVRPLAPADYIGLTPEYSMNRQVRIALSPLGQNVDLLPAGEVAVVWQPGPDDGVPAGAAQAFDGRISSVNRRAELSLDVDPRPQRTVLARLTVDGYPRAFMVLFHCDPERAESEVQRDRRQVRITQIEDRVLQAGLERVEFMGPKRSLRVRFEVDAPVDSFVEGDNYLIEAGVENEPDGEFQSDEPRLSFLAPRQVEVELKQLTSAGVIKVQANVGDFDVNLDTAGINNKEVSVLVRLSGGSKAPVTHRFPVMLDGTPPIIEAGRFSSGPSEEVEQGAPLVAYATVEDPLSGVGAVEFSLTAGPEEPFKTPVPGRVENERNRYEAELPTKDLMPGDDYTLWVRARDKVGNATGSLSRPMRVVKPPPEPPPTTPGGTPKPSTLIVKVKTRQGPAPRIRVAIDGPADLTPATTDQKGEAVFTKVPPGAYKITASGFVTNSAVKGEAQVTLPSTADPEKEPAVVTINLVFE